MNYTLQISNSYFFVIFETLTNIFVDNMKIQKGKISPKTVSRETISGNIIITDANFTTLQTYFNSTTIFLYCKLYEGTDLKITGKLKLFENAIWN